MKQHSILVIDDDPDFVKQLTSLLQGEGFQVSATTQPGEAVDLYRRRTPDIVLTDLRMPGASGFSVLTDIKRFDPKANVVILTAYGEKDTVAQAFRLGAAEFFDKPLEVDRLLSTLNQLLQQEEQALEGDLRMMSLASIIQINCEERNQARLLLRRKGEEGRIYFFEGEIVHAVVGDLTGETAIYELLSWEDGTFQVHLGAAPRKRTIHKGWSGLLLEGMRRIDESTAGWSTLLDDEFSDQQEEEQDLEERVVRALNGIPEVNGALICSPDGGVLGSAGIEDPQQSSQLVIRLLEKTRAAGNVLNASPPERIVIDGKDSKSILQPQNGMLIYLLLVKRASIDAVTQTIHQILKRYRMS